MTVYNEDALTDFMIGVTPYAMINNDNLVSGSLVMLNEEGREKVRFSPASRDWT
jgi:hypothetical protein